MKKSTYESAQLSCTEMEGLVHDIQLKILASIEELLGVDVSDASGLHLAELRDKMKLMYFCQLDSLKKSQIDDLVSLLIHVHSSQKLMPYWENTLDACSDALDMIDLQQDTLPSISMEELDFVLTRFLEYARRKRDPGRNLLEDSLFDD